MFLLNIRGNTIRFPSQVKKLLNEQENKLCKEIKNLESQEKEDTLEITLEIPDSKLQGFMIRSRVQNILLNEKPTKFFCNLQKAKYIDKTIKKITLKIEKL